MESTDKNMRTNIDREKTYFATFERFEIEMSGNAALDCSQSGDCIEDVSHHAPHITRPDNCTPERLAAELKEYGAWNAEELADGAANWLRIVWIAAGNITEASVEAEE